MSPLILRLRSLRFAQGRQDERGDLPRSEEARTVTHHVAEMVAQKTGSENRK